MRLDSALKKSRPQYISAQKISTLFDALNEREIARWFSDARAFMAVPVSYYIYGKKIRNIDVKGIFVSKFTVPTYVIIIKIKVLLTLAELSTLFRPFGFLVPKDF
jgi:hypothetical protein